MQPVEEGEWHDLILKLVITPLHSSHEKSFSSLLETCFGPVHVALKVSNMVLEWSRSSLVMPHFCTDEDVHMMEMEVQPHGKWVEQQHPESSMAEQKSSYSEQIELTYRIASQKKTHINALINLIVKYNKVFYYDLFLRNGQNVVLDALRVLEVNLPKELPGGLREYYTALTAGKPRELEFKLHSDLDKYVMHKKQEESLDSMSQINLEVLLTLYFRFHLESRAELKEDHQALEAWQCGELQCCMEEVEKRIQLELLKINSFRPAQQ